MLDSFRSYPGPLIWMVLMVIVILVWAVWMNAQTTERKDSLIMQSFFGIPLIGFVLFGLIVYFL